MKEQPEEEDPGEVVGDVARAEGEGRRELSIMGAGGLGQVDKVHLAAD